MRNILIAFATCAALAVYFRISEASGLGGLVFFMAAAMFGALILVGLVPRFGHTPRGAMALLAGAAVMGWGVLWWAGEGGPLDPAPFAIAEEVGAIHTPTPEDFSPLGPHPDGRLAAEGR
jgi:hypothetical protein